MALRRRRHERRGEHPPAAPDLLRLWIGIGLKSVAGGQVIQSYAFELLVSERKWLKYDEWVQSWGVSQMAPGVNVIAVAALTGLRIAGVAGAVASIAGLMLPSVLVTVFVAAVYTHTARLPGVASALHGMFIAVAGSALVFNWRVGRPLISAAADRGKLVVVAAVTIPAAAAVLVFTGQVPVFAILLGAATVLSFVWARFSRSHD